MSESRPGTITEEAKSAIAASIGIDDVSAKNKKNTPKQLTISSSVLDFASVLAKPLDKTRFSRVWGLQNIALTPENDLRVFYPKGSFSPSSAPLGGAGFIYKLDTPIDTGRLSYQVKFEKGFNFVKG